MDMKKRAAETFDVENNTISNTQLINTALILHSYLQNLKIYISVEDRQSR